MRGFIDPARRESCQKPLWHLDLASGVWSEKSTAEVGFERGFYDYAGDDFSLEHPDEAFEKFEREFPLVRDRMLQRNYKGWAKQQKPFLLGYMQMMRARSPLFIQQLTAGKKSLLGARVLGVGPENQIQVDSLELRPLAPHVVRNSVLGSMREEIVKGPDWLWNSEWCLRYVTSPTHSFVTGPQPVMIQGPTADLASAVEHPETLVWFPISWEACLIGSRSRFDAGTSIADPDLVTHIRDAFTNPTTGYVIATQPFTWSRAA